MIISMNTETNKENRPIRLKPNNPKGLPFPQKVPGTALKFNPTDHSTFLVGTITGDVLLVRILQLWIGRPPSLSELTSYNI